MLQYGTGRYGGYAAPYTPFRRNRVAIAYRYANFLPASHRNSRSAPYTSRSPTDSNGILTPLRLCLSTARGAASPLRALPLE